MKCDERLGRAAFGLRVEKIVKICVDFYNATVSVSLYQRNVLVSKTRDALLVAYDSSLIDNDEFVLLYNACRSKNPELPYQDYFTFC